MWQVVAGIILISLVMWVLSSLFSTKDEEVEEAPPAPRRAPASRPRPSASEIDRFLEEMNRRRRQAAEQSTSPAPVAPRPRRPKPDRPEFQPTTAAPVPPPAVVRKPQVRRAQRPVQVVPIEVPRARKVVEVQPIEVQVVESATVVPALAASAAPTNAPRRVSPALKALLPMLTSRKQLRSALLIHDVLGPPRCRSRLPSRSPAYPPSPLGGEGRG